MQKTMQKTKKAKKQCKNVAKKKKTQSNAKSNATAKCKIQKAKFIVKQSTGMLCFDRWYVISRILDLPFGFNFDCRVAAFKFTQNSPMSLFKYCISNCEFQHLRFTCVVLKNVTTIGLLLEHKTCDILASERLRLMRYDNQLIIDSFQKAICTLKW